MSLPERKRRDTGLNPLSTVQGDLHGLVDAACQGYGIQVELTYGWLYAQRARNEKLDVVLYGTGGGFVWRRQMKRHGLRNIILDSTPENPEVRRGPASEVFPRD